MDRGLWVGKWEKASAGEMEPSPAGEHSTAVEEPGSACPSSGRSKMTLRLSYYTTLLVCHVTDVRVWCVRRHCIAALVELEEAASLPRAACGVRVGAGSCVLCSSTC